MIKKTFTAKEFTKFPLYAEFLIDHNYLGWRSIGQFYTDKYPEVISGTLLDNGGEITSDILELAFESEEHYHWFLLQQ